MNLQYGCGLMEANGWFNCDASPTLRLQRLPVFGALFRKFLPPLFPTSIQYGDIVKGLNLPLNSCDAIYCSHVLEHLSLEDCRLALRRTHAYLKPGGNFRCVLPDFEQQVRVYLANQEATAAPEFLSYTFLGRKSRPKTLMAILREYFGNSHHLWMWDYKALAAELTAVGFKEIRRCRFGDSANADFRSVEVEGRFDWALAIECTK